MVGINGRRELLFVFVSVLIQALVGAFLGHYYDQGVFMATGYVVGSGGDPYKPIELVRVFENPRLIGFVPTIGYPPPWALVLGLIYHVSYGLVQNVFVYNFATKIPIIAANVALAYLVKNILLNLQADRKKAEAAWLFLLFNPFLILTTAAWGQIDSVAAVLCVAALFQLSKGYSKTSGILLGASVAIKQVAVPLVPLPLLFSERLSSRRNLWFSLAFLATVLTLWVAPFFLLGWSIPSTPMDVTSRFGIAGGMTLFNLAEILQGSPTIPSSLWFLGYLWVPALLIGYYFVYRNPPRTSQDLVCKAIGLTLIAFLTRSWLSEPNVNLILPLVLIAAGLNKIDKRSLHLIWIIPLVFMIVNNAFPQLFFLIYPTVLDSLAQFDAQFGAIRFAVRFAVAVLWSVVAWKIAFQMIRGDKKEGASP